jgi:hypothetical protein
MRAVIIWEQKAAEKKLLVVDFHQAQTTNK